MNKLLIVVTVFAVITALLTLVDGLMMPALVSQSLFALLFIIVLLRLMNSVEQKRS